MNHLNRLLLLVLAVLSLSCGGRKEPAISAPPAQNKILDLISSRVIAVSEPSGLAYNEKSNTLFCVSDGNGTIYELTLAGEILRQVQVEKNDLEGINFSPNFDTVYVAEEATYQVVGYSPSGERLRSWKNVTSGDTKSGYEGVTRTPGGGFVVINEKSPILILETDYSGRELRRREVTYSSDLSDVCYDAGLDCYWIVSHESKLLMKLNTAFILLNSWSFEIEQAEGVAVTQDRIYIVSDSDSKFFTFKKPN